VRRGLLGDALDAFAVDRRVLDAAELAENILAPQRQIDKYAL
jgi:hypothetical protein